MRWGVGGARGKVFGGISAHGLEWEELVGESAAQERGCLAEGGGRDALFAKGAKAEGVVAFGEADTGVVGEERAVVENGWFELECAVEEELAGSGEEKVRAAHDFGDAHGGVVHGDGELVGGYGVVPPEDEVAEVFSSGKGLRAEAGVHKGDSFAVGNAEAEVDFG